MLRLRSGQVFRVVRFGNKSGFVPLSCVPASFWICASSCALANNPKLRSYCALVKFFEIHLRFKKVGKRGKIRKSGKNIQILSNNKNHTLASLEPKISKKKKKKEKKRKTSKWKEKEKNNKSIKYSQIKPKKVKNRKNSQIFQKN